MKMNHPEHKEQVEQLQRNFHLLINFINFHHSKGERPPDERKQLDAAIANFMENMMELFNTAVTAAKARADALQTEINTLTAAAANSATDNQAAITAAVAAATAGMIPEQAAVAAVNTIAAAPTA